MEIHLSPNTVFKVAVQDGNVLIRLGLAKWHPISPNKAFDISELLARAGRQAAEQRLAQVQIPPTDSPSTQKDPSP